MLRGMTTEEVRITDPAVMRALAHPARLAILEYLAGTPEGATATESALASGQSPSATSYHLRALAKLGLVEEAPSRGDARERVWRAPMRSYRVEAGQNASQEARAAERALVDVYLQNEDEKVRRWLDRAQTEPAAWYENAVISEHSLLVTAAELRKINETVQDLLHRYRRRDRREQAPEGARPVTVQYRSLPD
jgi:DNA-binding transcriptional ArsR family regulator